MSVRRRRQQRKGSTPAMVNRRIDSACGVVNRGQSIEVSQSRSVNRGQSQDAALVSVLFGLSEMVSVWIHDTDKTFN